jgi:hypothetical protein
MLVQPAVRSRPMTRLRKSLGTRGVLRGVSGIGPRHSVSLSSRQLRSGPAQTVPERTDSSHHLPDAGCRAPGPDTRWPAPGVPPRRRWRTASEPSRKRCPVAVRFKPRLLRSRSRVGTGEHERVGAGLGR